MRIDIGSGQIDGKVTLHGCVMQKIFFHDFSFVAKAEDKPLEPMLGITLHDVPKNRTIADFDHRFGAKLGLFAKSRTKSAAENEYRNVTIGWHRV